MTSKKNSNLEVLPTWDLSDLYSSISDKKINADLKKIAKNCENFVENYQNKIDKISAKNLLQAIKSKKSNRKQRAHVLKENKEKEPERQLTPGIFTFLLIK